MRKLPTAICITILFLLLIPVSGFAKYKDEKPSGNYSTIGAEFYNRIKTIRRLLTDKKTKGVVVVMVYPETPADKAGLKVGDIVTAVNGQRPQTFVDVVYDVEHTAEGMPITLTIKRNGSDVELPILVVAAQSITNLDFKHYYLMRLQYGQLTYNLNVDPFNPINTSRCRSALHTLVKNSENNARAKGHLLLAEKYAAEAKKFQ